jgi:hypothetical protein
MGDADLSLLMITKPKISEIISESQPWRCLGAGRRRRPPRRRGLHHRGRARPAHPGSSSQLMRPSTTGHDESTTRDRNRARARLSTTDSLASSSTPSTRVAARARTSPLQCAPTAHGLPQRLATVNPLTPLVTKRPVGSPRYKAVETQQSRTGCPTSRDATGDLELSHPVVQPRGVHEHLLNVPGRAVVRGLHVRMTEVPGLGSRRDPDARDDSLPGRTQALDRPRLIVSSRDESRISTASSPVTTPEF